jgi:CysZ protein
MLNDLKVGILSYYRSLGFIFQHNLWWFFIFPAIFSALMYFAGDAILQDLRTSSFGDLPQKDFEYNLLVMGLKAIFVFVAFKLNKNFVLLILSPVLTWLSAHTEKIISKQTYPFDLKTYYANIIRAVNMAIRNIFIQLLFIALWFLVALIFPVIMPYTEYFVYFVGFYFYGFSFIDYVNERKKMTVEESILFVRKHYMLASVIGLIFTLIFLIPYVGVVFAPITATVAAAKAVEIVLAKPNN